MRAGPAARQRLEKDGSLTVLADAYEGKQFNQPNDLTIDSRGPDLLLRPALRRPQQAWRSSMPPGGRSKASIGSIPDGKVTRIITHEVDRPNGLVVTPDDKYLFVADNNNNTVGGARKLWRFDLKADGTVDFATQKLIHDWKTTRGPDGMKLDAAGRLFVAAGLNRQNPPFETQDQADRRRLCLLARRRAAGSSFPSPATKPPTAPSAATTSKRSSSPPAAACGA